MEVIIPLIHWLCIAGLIVYAGLQFALMKLKYDLHKRFKKYGRF